MQHLAPRLIIGNLRLLRPCRSDKGTRCRELLETPSGLQSIAVSKLPSPSEFPGQDARGPRYLLKWIWPGHRLADHQASNVL
jgi:hypothetical protein